MTPGQASIGRMKSYGQYCPVARAAEVLGRRWTLLILRDLHFGCRHFNELRKGVPLISPSLLSRRLKELEEAGLVERRCGADGRSSEYRLTAAGHETRAIIELFGVWGQRWVRNVLGEDELDESLLMWAIRGNIDAGKFPASRTVIQFKFTDRPKLRYDLWWLVVDDGDVDMCIDNPGFDVDLYVTTELRTLTKVSMGDISVREAVRSDAIELHGSRSLAAGFGDWLGLSPFAHAPRPPKPLRFDDLVEPRPAEPAE